ncbi:HAD-IIB family hydrolase [Paraglaciecola aestuariivivens]
MQSSILIFTDLDGTLLDHQTYSFAPAKPMLDTLLASNIPVIPNTSKTFAELIPLRKTLSLSSPFIVENGAAVYMPIGCFDVQPKDTHSHKGFWVKEFSPQRAHWLSVLDDLSQDFAGQFSHFYNMSNEDICQATGLSLSQAKLANQREYTEPVLWQADLANKQRFVKALEKSGVSPVEGGRFLHLTGHCNKGDALLWLAAQYAQNWPQHKFTTIALGDGQNDISMLEAADIAVRIRSLHSPLPELSKTHQVFTSNECGPAGWSACLDHIIFNFLNMEPN